MSGQRKKLGRILLKQRLVTPEELEGLLEEQRSRPGQRLASTAQSVGMVGAKELLQALSEQHGLPGIDLGQVVVPIENLRLVPEDIAKAQRILPILVKEDRIFLAMADPGDKRVIDEIEFVTGRRVFPYVALQESLEKVIDACYRQADDGDGHYIGPSVPPDYLESLGLAPPSGRGARVSSIPPTEPSGIVRETSDELGIAELEAQIPEGQRVSGPSTQTNEPFASQVAPLPGPDDDPRVRPETPKVLLVDDEDDIRKLLRRVLEQKGFDVAEAAKGLEALQKVRDEAPDVILLDAMLPEVHGFDICRRIKGSKRYGHIPVIMVSAIYRGWRVAEDLKASYGVEVFLEKPFKISDVVTHVERALDGRPAEVQAQEQLSAEAGAALEAGMDAYRGGDIDGAIAHLREGIGIDPLSFQLHYHLGLLQGRRDETFEAIHQLETAVDLQPKNFSALKNLAVLYQRAGFKHKAIEMWERALGTAPDDDTRKSIKDHLMSLL
ncbi:MAG: response regulator [Myxococcota bacterium]